MGVLRHYMQNWAGVNGVIRFIRVSGPSPNVQSMISASTLPLQGPPNQAGPEFLCVPAPAGEELCDVG